MQVKSTFKVSPRLVGEGVVEISVAGNFSGQHHEVRRIREVLEYTICKVAKVLRIKGCCENLYAFISAHAYDRVVEKIAA